MKRILIIMAICCLGILAACSNDNNDNEKKDSTADEKPATEQQDPNEQPDADEDEQSEDQATDSDEEKQSEDDQDGDEEDQKSDSNDQQSDNKLSSYEEYPYLKDHIDDLSQYDPIVETDNPDKRVILYKNGDEEKKYKSVYIKHQKRLKIIELGENGQIFNEKIS